ncbi:hypothetical protein TeGR_g10955, partial [Tetraparma gracilis]
LETEEAARAEQAAAAAAVEAAAAAEAAAGLAGSAEDDALDDQHAALFLLPNTPESEAQAAPADPPELSAEEDSKPPAPQPPTPPPVRPPASEPPLSPERPQRVPAEAKDSPLPGAD